MSELDIANATQSAQFFLKLATALKQQKKESITIDELVQMSKIIYNRINLK